MDVEYDEDEGRVRLKMKTKRGIEWEREGEEAQEEMAVVKGKKRRSIGSVVEKGGSLYGRGIDRSVANEKGCERWKLHCFIYPLLFQEAHSHDTFLISTTPSSSFRYPHS